IALSARLLMGLVLAGPVALALPLRAQPAPGAAKTAPVEPAPIQPVPGQAAPVPAPDMPTVGIAPAPAPEPPPPPAWLPRHTAVLQIVEKVDATDRSLAVPVGSTAKIGTLAIEVKACVVRPPGQERDAAAYLEIVGKSVVGKNGKDKAAPLFKGWILAAEPAVSVFQDPIYDVRVTGCE
ncbi:MAG: DUF2155 domain-containing protein, partial [Acetobacteraceae bacterium]